MEAKEIKKVLNCNWSNSHCVKPDIVCYEESCDSCYIEHLEQKIIQLYEAVENFPDENFEGYLASPKDCLIDKLESIIKRGINS